MVSQSGQRFRGGGNCAAPLFNLSSPVEFIFIHIHNCKGAEYERNCPRDSPTSGQSEAATAGECYKLSEDRALSSV